MITSALKGGSGSWKFVLLLAGSILFYVNVPSVHKSAAWAYIVLHNWHEYGFVHLRGKMVSNAGGYGVEETPYIYTGHRPFVLYAAYFLSFVTGQGEESGLAFYLLLALGAAIAIWRLLGDSAFALTVAVAVPLCPGFLKTPLSLDTLAIPVLLGLPALWGAIRILETERLTWKTTVALFLLLSMYALLNWTTVFTFAVGFAYLVVAMRRRPSRWIYFALFSGAAVLAVGLLSFLDKKDGNSGSEKSMAYFYGAYLFGPQGYAGNPMNWTRAIIRIGLANLVALLPLLVLVLWRYYHAFRRRSTNLGLALLPFGMCLLTIAGMRNYFAAHHWMAAPVLIIGLVFSLRLLGDLSAEKERTTPVALAEPAPWLQTVFLGATLVYGFVIVEVMGLSSVSPESLRHLVIDSTQRHDLIVYSAAQDSFLASFAERIEPLCDRKMFTLTEWQVMSTNSLAASRHVYKLTASPNDPSGPWVARTVQSENFIQKNAESLLVWYLSHITKGGGRERLDFEGAYYLYRIQ